METGQYYCDVQGIRTKTICAGDGPGTLVLLHGGGIDNARLSWGHLIDVLSEKTRVIAFDWPGYGESDPCPGKCTVEFLVDFLQAFLDMHKLERVSLAGLSMGGSAALGFALRCPERLEKLVLAGSYGLQPKAAWHFFSYLFVKFPGANELAWRMMRSPKMVRWSLGALLRRPGSVTDELVDMALFEMNKPGAGKSWNSFQNDEMTLKGTRTCYIDRLHELRVPTLILHGSLDTAVPPQCAHDAHVRIANSSMHWMEGCGHWVQRDNPEEFLQVIENYLLEGPQ